MASNQGLYSPAFEHDACGIGFVANIKGNKSHQNISDALTVLENMEHRGACGCENNTGDGAGIMIQVPHEFFFDECIKLGVHLPSFGKYGVGVIFFPNEVRLREECRDIFNRTAEKLGLEVLAYRKVPTNSDALVYRIICRARNGACFHRHVQIIFRIPKNSSAKLFVLRNYASHIINNTVRKDQVGFYIARCLIKQLYIKVS
jgi:glutamate synthase (NADPH/NADH) large chain